MPGAGLGRLAFELAAGRNRRRHRVTALDISPVMVAATAAVLHLLLFQKEDDDHRSRRLEFYPFIHDPLINQRAHAARFHPITSCPDAAAVRLAQQLELEQEKEQQQQLSLSLEIADLVRFADAQPASQDALVTCFFIDTGLNVLDYLWAIHRLLRPGGFWVNLGPLNFHQTLGDGAVQLTWEEVEWAAAEMGLVRQPAFDLVPEPCAYRPEPFPPSAAEAAGASAFLRSDVYQPVFGVYKKKEGED